MINLLPDSYKKEIRAARTNVTLLRYNFLFLGAVGFLLASSLLVYVFLSNSKAASEQVNRDNVSKSSEYASTQKAAEEYRKNLSIASKILNNEVTYTDRVFDITKLLPKGVVLDSLNLNAKEFGTQTLINAHAKDFTAASELKRAFEESPLFSNVHFQVVSNDESNEDSQYPISISINVTMNKADKK